MTNRVTEKVVARARAVQILKKITVFDGLLEDEYFKVLNSCNSAAIREGETLFKQGDEGKSMFILLQGEIKVIVDGVGTVHTMQPGEILGEISLVKNVKRTASAVASTDSILLQLYNEMLQETVEKHPRIGYIIMKNVARILAERLVNQNKSKKK